MQPNDEPTSAVEVLRSEALTDADDTVQVPLGPDDDMIEVLPSRLWRSSAMAAINGGNFELWASKCLTPESYEVWLDVDPTNEEVGQMLAAYREIDGLDPLASRASRRSSKRGRRR